MAFGINMLPTLITLRTATLGLRRENVELSGFAVVGTALSWGAGMFDLKLGVIPLLLMPPLASSDMTAATSEPFKLRSMARIAMRTESLPISAAPPRQSPPEALSRTLEQRGCAAVERRTPLRKIDSAVARAAQTLLDLPMGAGRLMSVNGRELLFCLELHYHEPGFERGPDGWHKGVTVYFTT